MRLFLTRTLRPVLGHVILLVGVAGMWMACSLHRPPGSPRTGADRVQTVLHLMIIVPSLFSLLIHGFIHFASKRIRDDWYDSRPHRRNLIPSIPTPSQRVKEIKVEKLNEVRDDLYLEPRKIYGFVAPAVSLFLLLAVRLFLGQDIFDGSTSNLDYGWEFGLAPDSNSEAVKVIAFDSSHNRFGSTTQGLLASLLLFPAVLNFFLYIVPGDSSCCSIGGFLRRIIRLMHVAFCIQPIYSVISAITDSDEAVAGTGYNASLLEWSYGFLIGLPVGDFITAIIIWRRVRTIQAIEAVDDDDESAVTTNNCLPSMSCNSPNQQESFTSSHEKVGKAGCLERTLEWVAGFIFLSGVVLLAIYLPLTWHNCRNGDGDDCINHSSNVEEKTSSGKLYGFFFGLPVAVFFFMAGWLSERY